MEEIENRIIKMFPRGVELLDIYKNYDDNDYIEILNSVNDLHCFDEKPSYYSWCAFLYSGCLKFSRWTVPSPFIVKSDMLVTFRRFIEALIEVENGISDNTCVFILEDIRSEIFKKFDCITLTSINQEEVGLFLKKIASIGRPNNNVKLEEFLR